MVTSLTVNKSTPEPQPDFQGKRSFVKRLIEISVKLADNSQTNQPGQFSESGSNTVVLSGSRTSVRIQNSGGLAGSMATVDIYGLTPSIMNQLSTLGMVFNIVPRNTITISAGDEENGLSVVFVGTITAGYGDYNAAPDVPFHFEANAGLADAVAPATASSYPGATDVADIMASFARQMGLTFENNGVTVKLASPYFSGNIRTQMQNCAQHAGINAEVIGNILAIWPKGGSRKTPSIPIISKDTGMVGYPGFTQQGIYVRTLFNPQITFGGQIQVNSVVNDATIAAQQAQSSSFKAPTNNLYAVSKLDLALDSQVPHGQWMATILAYNPNYPKPIPPQVGGT